MATPDYVLFEDYTILAAHWASKVIPAGTFVRPIDYYYVPMHVRNAEVNKFYDKNTDCFCYTSFGIIVIPINKIRRV